MRRSLTLNKLRAAEPVRICALGHHIPAYMHMAADCGFDCIWLDLEHRHIGEHEVRALLAHARLANIDCMVRPPTLEKSRLYRYLEDGATGLMIPHVSTPEKAKALVDAVKFPPIGDRGLDGTGLDVDCLFGDIDAYVAEANRETFLVVQIETPLAVENIDAIAAVEGVDGLFVGTGDLGMRLRLSESSMTVDDALAKVAAAADRHETAWGCPADSVDRMKQMHAMGARLVAHGGDYFALREMLEASARDYDAAIGS